MSDYPGAVDTFRTIENDPGIVYDPLKTKVVYAEDSNALGGAIIAVEETLGLNPQGSSASVAERLTADETLIAGKQAALGFTPEDVANKSTSTSLGTSDTLYASQKAVKTYVDNAISTAVAAAKSALFPVGSYYINETDSTNPGTLLGFGTWAAAAVGRVPVGKASSGTFGTAGATGGEETHTLTGAESGTSAHSHRLNQQIGSGGGSDWPAGGNTGSSGTQFSSDAIANSAAANASSAHNNLQPYVVVYIWKRTA